MGRLLKGRFNMRFIHVAEGHFIAVDTIAELYNVTDESPTNPFSKTSFDVKTKRGSVLEGVRMATDDFERLVAGAL
jgi:hypothetical protein